jgi:hypothetical protein
MPNPFSAITTIVAVLALLLIGGFASPTASAATNSFNVNLNVEAGNQDRGDDESAKSKGQSASLIIRINEVERGQDFITINWETTVRSQPTVRWSPTEGGEETVQASQENARDHTTRLQGLDPGTSYDIELQADAVTGETERIEEVIQTRLPEAPDSPSLFSANLTANNAVSLSWGLPETNSDYVRVTKSAEFFPQQPMDGELVYEGRNEQTEDTSVQVGETYFYSAFVRSDQGQWSAPSVVAIYVPTESDTAQQPDIGQIVEERPEAPTSTQNLLPDLSFADLIFSQADRTVVTKSDVVALAADQRFSVGLDYDRLPEVLKTIVVTVSRPDSNQSFSFLLRGSKEAGFYSATVGALKESGLFDVEATVLDYKNRRVKTVTGQIQASSTDQTAEAAPVIGQFYEFGPTSSDAGGFVLLLLFILIAGGLIIGLERWLVSSRKAHR